MKKTAEKLMKKLLGVNPWLLLLAGAVFETGWAIGFKAADSVSDWALAVLSFALCTACLFTASRTLPAATAYTVFTGLGTAGTFLAGILLFGDSVSLMQCLFTGLLLAGVFGLKASTSESAED